MTGRTTIEPLANAGASSVEWLSQATKVTAKPKVAAGAEASFEGLLAPLSADASQAAEFEGAPLGDITRGLDRKGSQSGKLSPTQQFESFVLRTFVESMLPSKNSEFYGEGTAGDIWKSMLAERIGDEMARGGGIGIAKMLDARKTEGGNVETAKAALVKDQALAAGADVLRRR